MCLVNWHRNAWLHADERGSIVAVSNGTGAVTNVNAYDEYGIPRSTNVGRFQYTGQQWLSELGMYHYRARIYSPTLGRFMQTDPIGYEGGMNLYAYVGNDPMNFIDPTGLMEFCGRTLGPVITTPDPDGGSGGTVEQTWNEVCWDATGVGTYGHRPTQIGDAGTGVGGGGGDEGTPRQPQSSPNPEEQERERQRLREQCRQLVTGSLIAGGGLVSGILAGRETVRIVGRQAPPSLASRARPIGIGIGFYTGLGIGIAIYFSGELLDETVERLCGPA